MSSWALGCKRLHAKQESSEGHRNGGPFEPWAQEINGGWALGLTDPEPELYLSVHTFCSASHPFKNGWSGAMSGTNAGVPWYYCCTALWLWPWMKKYYDSPWESRGLPRLGGPQ